MYSINDLDFTKSCEQHYEFELVDVSAGKGTGIHVTVIGGHAKRISDFTKKVLNENRVKEAMQEKIGTAAKPRLIEDDIAFSTELVALRIVGWRGEISDPYSHENAIRLCTVNPPIKEQILKASDDLSNFPLVAPKS